MRPFKSNLNVQAKLMERILRVKAMFDPARSPAGRPPRLL